MVTDTVVTAASTFHHTVIQLNNHVQTAACGSVHVQLHSAKPKVVTLRSPTCLGQMLVHIALLHLVHSSDHAC
jgi:hypothetical protein